MSVYTDSSHCHRDSRLYMCTIYAGNHLTLSRPRRRRRKWFNGQITVKYFP